MGPEARDAAELRVLPAAPDVVPVLQQEERAAAQRAAVAAPDAVARLREVAPGAPAADLPSAVAWAAVWVFHRDQVLPWPAPQPAAWFARATACLQTASPSERWWQAATNEVLS